MGKVVIDSNLLILLIVGITDKSLIKKHKRTQSFDLIDFDILTHTLSKYSETIITPHILTETSNLISQTNHIHKKKIQFVFSTLTNELTEFFTSSHSIMQNSLFLRFGLTDCAILDLIKADIALITNDFDLYLEASKQSNQVFNFTHIREDYYFHSS